MKKKKQVVITAAWPHQNFYAYAQLNAKTVSRYASLNQAGINAMSTMEENKTYVIKI